MFTNKEMPIIEILHNGYTRSRLKYTVRKFGVLALERTWNLLREFSAEKLEFPTLHIYWHYNVHSKQYNDVIIQLSA